MIKNKNRHLSISLAYFIIYKTDFFVNLKHFPINKQTSATTNDKDDMVKKIWAQLLKALLA